MKMESLRHNQQTSTGQVQSLHKESKPTLDTGDFWSFASDHYKAEKRKRMRDFKFRDQSSGQGRLVSG